MPHGQASDWDRGLQVSRNGRWGWASPPGAGSWAVLGRGFGDIASGLSFGKRTRLALAAVTRLQLQGFTKKGIIDLQERAGFEVTKVKKYGILAYTFAGFPDHLGILRFIPGNALLTKFFIGLDRLICATPGLSIFGFHIVTVAKPR